MNKGLLGLLLAICLLFAGCNAVLSGFGADQVVVEKDYLYKGVVQHYPWGTMEVWLNPHGFLNAKEDEHTSVTGYGNPYVLSVTFMLPHRPIGSCVATLSSAHLSQSDPTEEIPITMIPETSGQSPASRAIASFQQKEFGTTAFETGYATHISNLDYKDLDLVMDIDVSGCGDIHHITGTAHIVRNYRESRRAKWWQQIFDGLMSV